MGEVEGIYLVQRLETRDWTIRKVTHRGFILYSGPTYPRAQPVDVSVRSLKIETFDDAEMPAILERARFLLGRDREIPVFEARKDVFIYDGEL